MAHGIEEVVSRGMCVGCGACSVRTSGAIPVTIGRRGVYEAHLDGIDSGAVRAASRVCPFSDDSPDEDSLTRERFPDLPVDHRLGAVRDIVAGRIASDTEVMRSSSGGLTSLLLVELLREGRVDGILHVGRPEGDERFAYTISTSAEEVLASRKSMYASTTLANVLGRIRGDGRRYAVVGVPCFITAARHLAREMPDLGEQLVVFVGLVCGHLKSTFYAESLAWQAGVAPQDLERIDFRVKAPERSSGNYDYEVTARGATEPIRRRTGSAFDTSWGFGAFQPEACNFCDDVFAESADVAFADAWLPQYEPDSRGTNVVVVRDEQVGETLQRAAARGEADLEPLSADDAAASQGGNYRHRRVGLAVRLADDLRRGRSVPRKRVAPDRTVVSRRRAALIRQRRRMSVLSLERFAEAREAGDFSRYERPMQRAIRRYWLIDAATHGPRALAGFLKHRAKELLRR